MRTVPKRPCECCRSVFSFLLPFFTPPPSSPCPSLSFPFAIASVYLSILWQVALEQLKNRKLILCCSKILSVEREVLCPPRCDYNWDCKDLGQTSLGEFGNARVLFCSIINSMDLSKPLEFYVSIC